MCDLGLEQGETPHRVTVVAIVVVGRIGVATVEVQVVRLIRIVRRRRPIATVAADIVDTAGVHVPASDIQNAYGKRNSCTLTLDRNLE